MDWTSDVLRLNCNNFMANGKQIFKSGFVLTINHSDYPHKYPFPVCEIFRMSVISSDENAQSFKYQVFPQINPAFLIELLESFLQKHKNAPLWILTEEEKDNIIKKKDFEFLKVTFDIFEDGEKWGIKQEYNPLVSKKIICECVKDFLKQYKNTLHKD